MRRRWLLVVRYILKLNEDMSENRYLQGCDFTTLCLLRGRYATDNVEIQDFDLRQCTDIHVRIAKLNDAGEVQSLWDVSRYGEYVVLAGNILRINWVGPKMPLGTFSVDFIAKYQGANIRMYTPTRIVFDIVERSEDVNIPAESLIDSNTYLLEGDLLLMLTGGVQADWEQADASRPDYIKNKPEIGSGLSENNFSDSDKEKLDDIDSEAITNLELEQILI